jgi:signal transduction histidine kinase
MLLPTLRTQSLRARLTLIAAGAAVFVLIPLAIAANVVVRHAVSDHIWDLSLDTATRVAAGVRDGTVPNPVPTGAAGINLIEVVGPDGNVIAGSAAAKGLHRLSPLRPGSDTRAIQTTSCSLPHHDCLLVTALRVSPRPDSDVVYAGRAAPDILTTPLPEMELLLLALVLALITGWVAWKATGRALQPVETMSSELAEITPLTSAARVRQPAGNNEIARLARTANDALERLDKSIQQQRQFAADASHELLTPIAGIRAQLEGARLHPEDTEEALDAALRDTDRLSSIVADLLLLARARTVPDAAREEVDLGALAATEVAHRPQQIPIRLKTDPGVTVRALRGQLCRVVTNLLDNAERHALSYVCLEVRRSDDQALLCVSNDGDPIPVDDRERIFERFYRRDAARSRSHGGTGLGLAIAREVIEAHSGTIRVEDGDAAVRFVIRLPLARSDTAEPPPAG